MSNIVDLIPFHKVEETYYKYIEDYLLFNGLMAYTPKVNTTLYGRDTVINISLELENIARYSASYISLSGAMVGEKVVPKNFIIFTASQAMEEIKEMIND